MANKKVNILEKKIPFPLSIRRFVVVNFEDYCKRLEVSTSAMVESMILELLHESKFDKNDKN